MLNKKFENLEKKFGMVTDVLEELEIEVVEEHPLQVVTENTDNIFSIDSLKQDFVMVRDNIIKLVTTGQRILDTASILDVSDMKASQLQALAEMQTTIGNNLKLLISIYKEITDIEKSRSKNEVPNTSQVANVGVINNNNNIVFNGTNTELLDLIHQNQLEND